MCNGIKKRYTTMYNRNYCGSLVIEFNFLQKNITSGKNRNFKNVTDGYTRPMRTHSPKANFNLCCFADKTS